LKAQNMNAIYFLLGFCTGAIVVLALFFRWYTEEGEK